MDSVEQPMNVMAIEAEAFWLHTAKSVEVASKPET